ncbi:MAG TPA: galactose oxidase-like domain-containing protein, partial [Methylophilaceae bacterium]|nr:galactose oxidase-like domain-containing protein [Methylophilaceae bacterium]
DGRLFVAGGHIQNSVGLPDATIYNPFTNTWSRQPQMNQGRWYPTTQLLPNGDVVVVSGDVDITTGSNPLPQVWQIATGTWRSLTNAQLKLPLYPYLFLAPNGRIFDAGPSISSRYLDTAGTGAWSFVGNHVFTSRSRTYGAAVMYQPGKILNVGGGDPPTAVTEVIDLNAGSPKWRNTAPMANARRQMNATLLPDGKVLATGGTKGAGFNDPTPANLVFAAEMWDPATEKWTTMASATVPRLYHSIATLLPDGRVLSTGGNGYTQTEFYSPPYLFAGPRPTLSSAPTAIGKGQSFFVGTPDATTVDTVSWIKIGSVTHTTNMNQGGFFTTSFTRQAGGITITAPNTTTVTSGHYMLFLLRGGVPSIAKIVRLDANATNNPVPSVSSISPTSAAAGGPAFTLTVNGSNFVAGSTVRWNGSDRTTTLVSATQLTAAIPASDITTAGTAQVTVFNPTPGGGTSSALTFTIGSASNPVPTTSSISPSSAAAGGPAFTLTVNGSNFVSGSIVRWNGANRTTTFVSATQLTAAIPASDIAAAGTAQVTVFNPTPGGGTSSAQTFTISSGGSGTNLASIGTPIARVTAPTGGGSKTLETIRDGVKPPVGSTSSTTQYDTYDGANTTPNEWIGYQFSSSQTFSRVVFQEGRHFADGGWFTTLTVQVLQSGVWVNVPGVTITPTYPGTNNGTTYESYTLQFTPISGNGIRIFGDPGGSADFISVGELEVYGS